MTGRRISLPRSGRMLDIRAASTEPALRTYSPSFCVAPCDIFPDYDLVMARLRGEQDITHDLEVVSTEVAREEPQMDSSFEDDKDLCVDGSDSDCESDSLEDTKGHGNDETYCVKPRARHVTSDISNTYSSRRASASQRRATRRPKPYEGRTGRRIAADRSGDVHTLGEQCAYINPHDGKRCQKLNKAPQEAKRHWRSCHLYKEAKEMLTGILAVGQGTAITSKAQLVEVTPQIKCSSCKALITRSDAMDRHRRTNCKAEKAE